MSKSKKPVIKDDFEAELRGEEQEEAPEIIEVKNIVYDTFTLGVLQREGKYDIVKIPISSEHGVTGPFEVLDSGLSSTKANVQLKLQLVRNKVVK